MYRSKNGIGNAVEVGRRKRHKKMGKKGMVVVPALPELPLVPKALAAVPMIPCRYLVERARRKTAKKITVRGHQLGDEVIWIIEEDESEIPMTSWVVSLCIALPAFYLSRYRFWVESLQNTVFLSFVYFFL